MIDHSANRAAEMEILVATVEEGGFSAAARRLGKTPSAVSKLISRLEGRLGTRLFNRSTRSLQLTAEGRRFYERATAILSDMAAAEEEARAGDAPSGLLRINTSASYAVHKLAPILPGFLDRYPDISVDLAITDHVVDLLAARADIAVRAGNLDSSSLIARKLGETPIRIVASPDYISRHGEPQQAADLAHHIMLGFSYRRAIEALPLLDAKGQMTEYLPTSKVKAMEGEVLRHLAIKGGGLVRMAGFTVEEDLAAGRLVEVLGGKQALPPEAFHAVYVGSGGPLPSRVRVMLDFLAEHGRVS